MSQRTTELFGIARATKGFMPDDEGEALYAAAREAGEAFEAATIVEIGSWCGKSTVYLGAAAEATGAVVVSIDHHRGSEELQEGWEHFDETLVDPHDRRVNTLPTFQRTIADARLERSVVGVVGESATVAVHTSPTAALVFIDGGHARDVAWADYRAWTPKVRARGWLCIHDVFEDPSLGGRPPYELFCEALTEGFVEVSATGSLRVLQRGAA